MTISYLVQAQGKVSFAGSAAIERAESNASLELTIFVYSQEISRTFAAVAS